VETRLETKALETLVSVDTALDTSALDTRKNSGFLGNQLVNQHLVNQKKGQRSALTSALTNDTLTRLVYMPFLF